MTIRGLPIDNPDTALPTFIHHLLPPGIRGVCFVLLFAASATTLMGVWSAMVSMIIGDCFQGKLQQSPTRSILITLALACGFYLLANLFINQIFEKIILANIPVASLSFALLAGFYWKRASKTGAFLSIVTSLTLSVGFYFFFGEEGGYILYWAFIGLPTTFLAGIGGSLLFPSSSVQSSPIL